MEIAVSLHHRVRRVRKNRDPYDNLSDRELLDFFEADGKPEWLGILLQRYTMLLLGVCMKYLRDQEEAKDAVQQVFLKVIAELPKQPIVHFKSWLYRVTVNHCLVTLRKRNLHRGDVETLQLAATEQPDLASLREEENRIDRLKKEIGNLNPEQQQCITLFYLEQKSYREISAQTGFSLLQVKSHIQNGKRNLKIQMGEPDMP
jgi:RNA polymerase sigma-70 factor (ECF subfamily)